MKAYCKGCGKDVEVPHRRGSKDWFSWWRKHYTSKHGGYKKRTSTKQMTSKKGYCSVNPCPFRK